MSTLNSGKVTIKHREGHHEEIDYISGFYEGGTDFVVHNSESPEWMTITHFPSGYKVGEIKAAPEDILTLRAQEFVRGLLRDRTKAAQIEYATLNLRING